MPSRPHDRFFSGIFALLATAAACAYVLLAMPRPLLPRDLPPLILARSQVEAQLELDRRLAKEAASSEEVRELYQSYLEEGLAEREQNVERMAAMARQEALATYAAAVFEGIGEEGVARLRARAVERYVLARAGAIADVREAHGLMGGFDRQLRTYGLVSRAGRQVAPELCVRALYKARWNLVHGLPPRSGLSKVELQAFEGWIALHAQSAPESRRLEAARLFQEAGGQRGAEALALWLLKAGADAKAIALLAPLAERGELRARNYILGVRASALE